MKAHSSVLRPLLAALLYIASCASANDRLLDRADACAREAAHSVSRRDQVAAYSKFFASLSAGELQNLTDHDDTSIALFARWALARSTSAEALLLSHPQRWLGFLEGRTGLAPPDIWAATLSCVPNAFLSHTAAIYQPAGLVRTQEFSWAGARSPTRLPSRRSEPPLLRAASGFYHEAGCSISPADGMVRFRTRDSSLQIPQQALDPIWRRYPNRDARCAFCLSGERLYAAFYDADGNSYPLLCFDAKSRKLLWKADVWALQDARPPQWGTMPADHRVDLVLRRNIVACFGIEGATCYLEAFESNSGDPIVQFSSDVPAHHSHAP